MNYPEYILVVNDDIREKQATICKRTTSTIGPVIEGTYTPYATGGRTEMRTLYKDLMRID